MLLNGSDKTVTSNHNRQVGGSSPPLGGDSG